MIDYEDLGRRIKKAREDAGMTQASLATKLGFTQSTISAWENASKRPSIDDLFRISVATGKPVSWLLDLADEAGVPTRAERFAEELKQKMDELMREAALADLTPEQEEVVRILRTLSPEDVVKVRDFARFLAGEKGDKP